MGHSYVGKWVNIGAGTTTSNLKNTYGEVKKELKRRYPKHAWPDDPLAAQPERRPQRRDEELGGHPGVDGAAQILAGCSDPQPVTDRDRAAEPISCLGCAGGSRALSQGDTFAVGQSLRRSAEHDHLTGTFVLPGHADDEVDVVVAGDFPGRDRRAEAVAPF